MRNTYVDDVQISLQASAVGVATGAEDVEVGLGLGKGKMGNGKMGSGIMMTKSSFSGEATTSTFEGSVSKDSQLKVVTWTPVSMVVLRATDGPWQAEGTKSLAVGQYQK